ncbi:ABC transporter ATP-binding protein [Methylomonas koyamae]|uniref:Polysaccharide/polyol phosphate ABC transporter ATP-binding protein n=1 Tax=Methylomonas koyamae TaxID=702114 RepID=A0A291IJW2_9GAMM|nr:ABC transporter ATP-binding protein [Methylomonas koyamae]ATG90447.1 polysaccharide/polyol phosphate ABC transporter ATP-binding protein [Methylomonas koyamae]OAI21490.1 polysaccharide/polyol phosphate ABC transporter ATP-binding protein [Methylomonas koyamae]
MAIIEVNHLTKEYQLGHLTSLKDTALNTLKRLTFQPIQERENFKALDDVNFHIEEGEVVGIIGHNGAGKSTLLKHLANISKPTKGEVIVRGSVAPLIEVGAGVNPELTGRENIFLNGAILGITKKTIQRKLDEIIDFSELEQFIDTPVKRYSSGMTVKLGFSIATSMEADILIVDEVLAVGDLAFQRKCFDRMENMIKREGKTVIVVSHNIRQIERLCKRSLLLKGGQLLFDGDVKQSTNLYYNFIDDKIKSNSTSQLNEFDSNKDVSIAVSLCDKIGNKIDSINYMDDLCLLLSITCSRPLINPIFSIGIHTVDMLYLTASRSDNHFKHLTIPAGKHTIKCIINSFPLTPGIYSVRLSLTDGLIPNDSFYGEKLTTFTVFSQDFDHSTYRGECFLALPSNWIAYNDK